MRDLIGFLVFSALILAFGILVLPPLAWIAWHILCALGEFAVWWVEWWAY